MFAFPHYPVPYNCVITQLAGQGAQMAGAARTGSETFEHTADIGLRVWAAQMPELFLQAGRGLIELMLDPSRVEGRQVRLISAQGEEPEDMLVAWLEEILFAFEVERFAPASVGIERFESGRISGRLLGEELDEEKHAIRHLIKAVTYHNLAIERTDEGWQVSIIFDV